MDKTDRWNRVYPLCCPFLRRAEWDRRRRRRDDHTHYQRRDELVGSNQWSHKPPLGRFLCQRQRGIRIVRGRCHSKNNERWFDVGSAGKRHVDSPERGLFHRRKQRNCCRAIWSSSTNHKWRCDVDLSIPRDDKQLPKRLFHLCEHGHNCRGRRCDFSHD